MPWLVAVMSEVTRGHTDVSKAGMRHTHTKGQAATANFIEILSPYTAEKAHVVNSH